MRKLVSLVLAAVVGLLATAGPASANGGFAMAVDVHTSQQTMQDQGNGTCTWEVASDVTVVNLTSQTLDISDVTFRVSWLGPDNTSGVQTDVSVINDAGLNAGVTFEPDERRTFSPVVVAFSIPCDATFGDLAVQLTSDKGSGSGDAPFLDGGTPVPPGAIGALALAAPVGLGLAARQRRRRAAATRA